MGGTDKPLFGLSVGATATDKHTTLVRATRALDLPARRGANDRTMSLPCNKRCLPAILLAAAMLAGCSGEYLISTPDTLTLPGAETPVVVRLQKREFWRYAPAAEGAALMYRREDGALQCARTDAAGFAAVTIAVGPQPGRVPFCLTHQDPMGDAIEGCTWVYVMDPARPIVAIDLDSLPREPKAAAAAGRALEGLGEQAQIFYVTEDRSGRPEQIRQYCASAGLPEAPVVTWRKARGWYRGGSWRSGPGEELRALRKRLPELKAGITSDPLAAETFDRAYMKTVFVGPVGLGGIIPADRVAAWPAVRMPPE